MRHQENFGAAHLSAADGVVAHKSHSGVSDHPVRFAATPPHEEGTTSAQNRLPLSPTLNKLALLNPITFIAECNRAVKTLRDRNFYRTCSDECSRPHGTPARELCRELQ